MRQNRVLMRFLLTAGALYVVWHLFYNLYMEQEGIMIRRVAENVASVSVSVLRMIGYDADVHPFRDPAAPAAFETLITLKGRALVWIDSGCTGLTLMALFAGFVLAWPGPVKRKLWYIPAGLVAIYIVNILRVVALAINHAVSNKTFDFNHKYTYTLVTYAVIFGLWMLWVNKLSGFDLGNVVEAPLEEKKEPVA